jgi:hypothetical protein
MAKKPPTATTIGNNPLDRLFNLEAVEDIVGKKRRPGVRPDTAVLTVTVPNDLADDLEQIIAVTPGVDLDTLATRALRQVLKSLQKKAQRSLQQVEGKKPKSNAGGQVVVIVSE